MATGFGFSTGVGGNTDAGISNLHPSGSTTISMTDTGSESEQINRATIGGGILTITNNPELVGLNRDTDKAQETTKDIITGALDGSMTVDNRLLTSDGRAQIITQHDNLVENIEQIGDGLRNNIVTKSIENYITDETKTLGETVSDYIEQDRQIADMQKNQKTLVDAVNGLTNLSAEDAQQALQEIANFVAGTDGFTGDLKLANIDGNVVGFAYQSNDGSVKNISINLANIDMTDPNALMKAIYHETTNFEAHDKNEQTAKNRGETGAGIFDLKNYGNENTNTMDNGQWLSNYGNSNTINSGNMSLASDAINSSIGNGRGNAELISLGALATLAVASYYGGEYAGTKLEQKDGESYIEANERFTEKSPLFKIDDKIGELIITGVADGADYISGDSQWGTAAISKVGEGYQWLDEKSGGNLDEALAIGSVVTAVAGGAAATTTKSSINAANKIDDTATAAAKALNKVDDAVFKNPLEGTSITAKVRNQALTDPFHDFPKSVDGFIKPEHITVKAGGDGVTRTFIDVPGSYKGKTGTFEWIIEPDEKTINHRFFRPNQ